MTEEYIEPMRGRNNDREIHRDNKGGGGNNDRGMHRDNEGEK